MILLRLWPRTSRKRSFKFSLALLARMKAERDGSASVEPAEHVVVDNRGHARERPAQAERVPGPGRTGS